MFVAFLLRWLRCQHEDRRREIRDGVLHFVCNGCGHAAPAITRTKAEQQKAKRLQARLAKKPGTVATFKRKRGA